MFRHGTDEHGALAGIAWWWLIRLLRVFDLDTVTDVAVSCGKSFLGVFCVGPGPVRLVALLLWRRNASLAGGFAGRPYLCFCGFV